VVQAAVGAQRTLLLEISDSAVGQDGAGKMFAEFQQLESGGQRQLGAVALSLALTRKLVEFLRGSIRVGSRKGSGSIITVSLPLPA
jgi:signal transduction histidine kinase